MNMTDEQRERAQSVNDRLAGLSEEDYSGALPEGFKDRIRTEVGIHLCFRDRVKVLFGVDTRTLTENVVGLARSRSSIRTIIPNWLLRWRMRKNRNMGYYSILPEESSTSEK